MHTQHTNTVICSVSSANMLQCRKHSAHELIGVALKYQWHQVHHTVHECNKFSLMTWRSTQNYNSSHTAWLNVEQKKDNLRMCGVFTWKRLVAQQLWKLAQQGQGQNQVTWTVRHENMVMTSRPLPLTINTRSMPLVSTSRYSISDITRQG